MGVLGTEANRQELQADLQRSFEDNDPDQFFEMFVPYSTYSSSLLNIRGCYFAL